VDGGKAVSNGACRSAFQRLACRVPKTLDDNFVVSDEIIDVIREWR